MIHRLAKWLAFVLAAYWGLLAILTPVTVTDSQVYNLARLPLAERYGLFGSHAWYSDRQLAFPWSFDAAHLLFLKLGFGCALPSFCCLLGILIVAFRLARDWAGKEAGWWTVLLILSMSTIVFQATSTKNDLGLVFAALAGFYALRRFAQTRDGAWLGIFAIAVGLLPGIKDTGLLAAPALLLIAAWQLRASPRRVLGVFVGCAAGAVAFGSVEIYWDNALRYGHLLGPPDLVAMHSNRDGVRGALANVIRYLFGIVNLGWTPPYGSPPYVPALERACRAVLHGIGLGNAGYQAGFDDAHFQIARMGGETTSDYALVGTVLVPFAGRQIFCRSWSSPARWLAVAGFLYLGAVAFTVAWMPWNIRFLMPCLVLFALAVTVGEQEMLLRSRVFQISLLAVAAFSAIVPTWRSFNKQPQRDLVGAVTRREWETYLELPTLRPVVAAAEGWLTAHPQGRLQVVAGANSWILPFFTLKESARVDAVESPGAGPKALLVLDRPDYAPEPRWKRIATFAQAGTALYATSP